MMNLGIWPTVARVSSCFLAGFALVITFGVGALEALASDDDRALLQRINAVRAEHKLIPLQPSGELAQVARGHARDMAARGYVAHESPEGKGPLDRTRSAGVSGFRLLAENIGVSNVAGDRMGAIIEEWLRSPLHRENLLNPAFNTTGIAVVHAPGQRTLYVQLFATY